MMLIEETAVLDDALPLDEFRAHLRLGTGFSFSNLQDEVLLSFLRAALAAIEARTGKVLLERSFRQIVHHWREPGAHPLSVAPVKAVSEIDVVTRDGVRAAVATDTFWLEQDAGGPVLRSVGACLPWVPTGGKAEIVMLAGYGDDWGQIPADLRQAVLMLAAHYYEFRGETNLSEGCMPFGVSSLIERYTALRLYAGGAR